MRRLLGFGLLCVSVVVMAACSWGDDEVQPSNTAPAGTSGSGGGSAGDGTGEVSGIAGGGGLPGAAGQSTRGDAAGVGGVGMSNAGAAGSSRAGASAGGAAGSAGANTRPPIATWEETSKSCTDFCSAYGERCALFDNVAHCSDGCKVGAVGGSDVCRGAMKAALDCMLPQFSEPTCSKATQAALLACSVEIASMRSCFEYLHRRPCVESSSAGTDFCAAGHSCMDQNSYQNYCARDNGRTYCVCSIVSIPVTLFVNASGVTEADCKSSYANCGFPN